MLDLIAHHSTVLDILRVVLLLEGGMVLGLSLFVFRLYRYARQVSARHGITPSGAPPYHVALIAVSHGLLVLTQMAVLIGRLGSDFAWYGAPIAIVAFTLSIVALVDLLQLENMRIHSVIQSRSG